ncbi:MAG: hypothetical protein K2X97_20655 [Mycobacteriaceae bacterium]|nr:hypothetical protein [Mycobacteriaceae bacterium]
MSCPVDTGRVVEEVYLQLAGQHPLLIVDLVEFGLEVVGIPRIDRLLPEAST